MNSLPAHPIGAAWLAQTYQVNPTGRLSVLSQIGGRRVTWVNDGNRLETYPEVMRPASEPAAHLQFHLRHEVPHLEFLARLFAKTGTSFVQEWVDAEPTGQYARRAAFLYEWLTGDTLQAPARLGGNYVDAIDDAKQMAASANCVVKIQRWRVNDNLPGTRHFCPTIIKTDAVVQASDLDVPRLFQNLTAEFGEDLLRRAAVWMTLRESKASLAIEGEADHANRIERFADVMARRTGQGDSALTDAALAQLQGEILGKRNTLTHLGLRQSPVFVGETIRYQNIVHYVAPPADDVPAMLEGLRVFLARTQGQSPVMRTTVAAFGFVYIHPLADGNGRVHRFLINDILRRDGAVPEPVILPVSAVITENAAERRSYDQVLDEVSKPLMQEAHDYITFTSAQNTYPDGVVSNFVFNGVDQVRPAWRYPDLGPHVVFLSKVIERTLTEQMREQSRYLRNHGRARQMLKEVVEMPDQQADRVLRSIEQNRGELSKVLAKQMPVLQEPGVWTAIIEAVTLAFQDDAPAITISSAVTNPHGLA
ncbi:MAG: Fic family protein [Paralcaligenes sp.]